MKNKEILIGKLENVEYLLNPDWDIDFNEVFKEIESIKTFINNNF